MYEFHSDLTFQNTENSCVLISEQLLAVEKDRSAGCCGCTIEELEEYLDSILNL